MVCSRCGKPLPEGTSFCPTCHAPGIAPLKTSGWSPPAAAPAAGAAAAGALGYAGFWLRFLAYLVDSVVLGLAGAVVSGFVGAFVGVLAVASGSRSAAAVAPASLVASLGVSWLYFALMESSARQATLGKMALGLSVTDAEGRRIGFGRASGRWFAKALSWLPAGIGFVLAGFTARKQALHDLVAGTLVVRRGKSGVGVVVAVAAGAALVGIAIVGMLAAIAIPNFIRYQLRAKSTEATTLVAALARAQRVHQQQTGRFVPLDLPAGGVPGSAKMAWTADDLAAAQAIGWDAPTSSWFSYRVAVAPTADGREAFSICAESDLDGDGKFAAVVLWQPTVNEAGNPDAAPPAPPCAHEPPAERSPTFGRGDPVGAPVRITPKDVF